MRLLVAFMGGWLVGVMLTCVAIEVDYFDAAESISRFTRSVIDAIIRGWEWQ